jgi:hypothetical protein
MSKCLQRDRYQCSHKFSEHENCSKVILIGQGSLACIIAICDDEKVLEMRLNMVHTYNPHYLGVRGKRIAV